MAKRERKLKKPGWLAEFKDFAVKGNALSLAVGVIIGGGFSTITKSLTDDIIMPVVSMAPSSQTARVPKTIYSMRLFTPNLGCL